MTATTATPTAPSSTPASTPARMTRRHDLDALRAIAMLLGIGLHAAAPLLSAPGGQEELSLVGLAAAWIHGFRMPLFFLLSGFFTAMLLRRRGIRAMLRQRFNRIFLPLVVFVPVVWLLLMPGMFLSPEIASASFDLSKSSGLVLVAEATGGSATTSASDDGGLFMHLWFLWFLCWLVVLFAAATFILDRLPLPRLAPRWVFTWRRYLWLLPLTMVFQAQMNYPSFGPDTYTGLAIPGYLLGYYAVFFGFGALYYHYRDEGDIGTRRWWLTVPFGMTALFLATFIAMGDGTGWTLPGIFMMSLFPWWMTFSLMGLFGRLFAGESRRMRYVSDSSYFLYIMHVPLIFLLNPLLSVFNLGAMAQFTLLCVLTTVILLYIYEKAVRYTRIGRFLNGPRHRPEQPQPVAA